MKAKLLVLLVVLAAVLTLAAPGYPGAVVAQVDSPALSGDGRPVDWGSPQLLPSGKPTDWDSPSYSLEGRPTDWETIPGSYQAAGHPEDWGSPSFSFWSIKGKPEDWDSLMRWFLGFNSHLFHSH